ncbi:MAG TPA: hypothetical protein PKJ19_07880 [Flavobacteriales bacterium]|nr:hypothetical protein [Flavobacteriales bacterium]
MDILLIPCWARPEFLHHCLKNLAATGDLSTVHVVFKPDTSFNPEILGVIDTWMEHLPSYEVVTPKLARYRHSRQSSNLLEGYAYAASLTGGLVFMVEEDVMVANDFFRFHRDLHAKEKVFAALSVRNPNRQVFTDDDPEAYYLSSGDYCSLGVSMRPEVIQGMILPHKIEGYFRDPARYCRRHFPNSTLSDNFVEQDGLIRRIQGASTLPTAYPHVPRAFHAGFYGYNRRQFVQGNLTQRIERLDRTIYNPEAMLKASLSAAYYQDSQPIPLQITPWKQLTRKQPEGASLPTAS